MTWIKRGVVIMPPTDRTWAASHAAVPHGEAFPDGRARVYFTARDARNRSHIAVADFGPGSWEPVIAAHPVLEPGPPGAFDDSGVMTSCLVRHQDTEYLYYQGWQAGVAAPFMVYVGCATRRSPDAEFERVSPAPVLDRSATDPFMCCSPWVLVENGVWRMWYCSNQGWVTAHGSLRYTVHIRYAESHDGLVWRRDGRVCLDFANDTEYVITRPCVVKDDDTYRMWYSYRGDKYRIGYAESADGLTWVRRDDLVGIGPEDRGWDSEMVEYACVFDRSGERVMLYNGNGYGATGVGLASLVE
ncbi:MAG: hypothetical protein ACTHMY_08840 [Solirubrobacteraceae bacterium]